MVFSSNTFLFAFLPAVLLLYLLCPKRLRNAMLLAVSLLFYAWGEPVYLFLMVFTILLNYFCALAIDSCRVRGKSGRGVLAAAIACNLALLGFFKYSGFIADTVNALIPSPGIPRPDVRLPIGISFYIFQSMSYTIDVWRGDVKSQRNPVVFGAYVSMFPQLIAGPIVRYRDVERQMVNREISVSMFSCGVTRFIIGLSKKMLLANRMGELCEALRCGEGCFSAWICMFAYTLQIYFDFSGYSDMAIGLGKMLGFDFLENFNYPYISSSITEFWRRWHISLSTWFREYVYIPLGGNRRGPKRQLLNLFVVWMLTGLWHGASWNFVIWGLYYGVLLMCEKLFLLKRIARVPIGLRTAAVFVTVSLGWVIFSFTDMREMGAFLSRLISFVGTSAHELNLVLAYLPLMAVSFVAATPFSAELYHRIDGKPVQGIIKVLWLAVLMLLCTAALAGQSYNPFIYFRF